MAIDFRIRLIYLDHSPSLVTKRKDEVKSVDEEAVPLTNETHCGRKRWNTGVEIQVMDKYKTNNNIVWSENSRYTFLFCCAPPVTALEQLISNQRCL